MTAKEMNEYFASTDGDEYVGMKLLRNRSASNEMDGGVSAQLKKGYENDWIEAFVLSTNRVEKRG